MKKHALVSYLSQQSVVARTATSCCLSSRSIMILEFLVSRWSVESHILLLHVQEFVYTLRTWQFSQCCQYTGKRMSWVWPWVGMTVGSWNIWPMPRPPQSHLAKQHMPPGFVFLGREGNHSGLVNLRPCYRTGSPSSYCQVNRKNGLNYFVFLLAILCKSERDNKCHAVNLKGNNGVLRNGSLKGRTRW